MPEYRGGADMRLGRAGQVAQFSPGQRWEDVRSVRQSLLHAQYPLRDQLLPGKYVAGCISDESGEFPGRNTRG